MVANNVSKKVTYKNGLNMCERGGGQAWTKMRIRGKRPVVTTEFIQ